jgi:NAD(P)-dependent dehydrogenase (short-subunit alcohol dehydrogenase family)
MIRTLLPTLRERGGRAVVVGSIAHRYSRTDERDIDFSGRARASLAYGNAKRYLMFSLYALFENEPCATLAVVHPGITFTNITAHYPKLVFALIKHPMKLIFMSPRRACLSVVRGVFEPCGKNEWIGPRAFDIWGAPTKRALHSVSEQEYASISRTATRIYGELSEE